MLSESSINNSTPFSNPLVSIITVTYNAEKYLEQTITSVLNQTYKNIEYIIIDGASTDNTIDIIKKYESQITSWVSEKDNGLYYAMNKGIDIAKGSIIGILNADDYYYPDAINNIVDAYLKKQDDIFHGDISLISNSSTITMTPDFSKMNQQPSIFHPTCFVKKTVYDTIGKFDTRYTISADYDFLLRCIKHNYTFQYVPKLITSFRTGGMSNSCYSNIEGYKIMKKHNTGFQNQVIWRGIKCYVKTFIKRMINFSK